MIIQWGPKTLGVIYYVSGVQRILGTKIPGIYLFNGIQKPWDISIQWGPTTLGNIYSVGSTRPKLRFHPNQHPGKARAKHWVGTPPPGPEMRRRLNAPFPKLDYLQAFTCGIPTVHMLHFRPGQKHTRRSNSIPRNCR